LRCREARERTQLFVEVSGDGRKIFPDGTWWKVRGRFHKHPKYGWRFKVEWAEESEPQSMANTEGVMKYLTLLPGVGKKGAEQLAALGLRKLLEDPNLIAEAVAPRYREQALAVWETMRPDAELAAVFSEVGVTKGRMKAIFERCGDSSGVWKVIRRDPWLLDEIPGISFEMADKIALRFGHEKTELSRLRHAIAWVIHTECMRSGNTSLPIETAGEHVWGEEEGVVNLVARKMDVSRERAREALNSDPDLVRSIPGEVTTADNYKYESAIYSSLAYLAGHPGLGIREEIINAVADERGLVDEQRAALHLMNDHPVAVLTGGPGTGKTTISGAFVEACRRADVKLALLAPTGLAAKRISQAAGQRAHTIHLWVHQLSKQSLVNYDALLVDECSMIDSQLGAQLLWSMGSHLPRIYMAGDAAQLPPVAPGRVFSDLIDSGAVPVARLDYIHRQAQDSVIPIVSKMIGQGQKPPVVDNSKEWPGWHFYEFDDPLMVQAKAEEIALKQAERFGHNVVALLSPMYKGEAGINALGRTLQANLNPNRPESEILRSKDFDVEGENMIYRHIWQVGDPVFHVGNDYKLGLSQAMRGAITAVSHNPGAIVVKWEDGQVYEHEAPFGRVLGDKVILGYALSWHRSQGSEFPAVTVALTNAHRGILSREALYTAITRAKQEVVLVGQTGAVDYCLGHLASARRTGLGQLLRQGIGAGF
jgi:exodeoxyribonuclease V alpha subunit